MSWGLVTSIAAPEMEMLLIKQLMVLPANSIAPDINTGLRGEARLSMKLCVGVNRTSETADFSTSNIPRRALSSSSAVARATLLPGQFEGEDPLRFRRKA
jgi:hypothetical protein